MSLPMPLAKSATFLPMIIATGLGIGGGIAFGIHYLKNNPEVVLRKRANPHPWNNVAQHTNTKLLSFNPEFWEGRSNAYDPRFELMTARPEGASRASQEKKLFEQVKHL
ncbi:hypothetical protein PCANC_15163 [Puccinia coronata f. sp. avenae]|uniref:NADH dehydrogenase [ubiquinone] 1 alpha subcomplex subunit 4 n=1 Tax=Puccinia coronata f. sp. avenae TaxID=200324 RepID=A0A2N5UJH7_9BASI|nr:hypothetical protein PCANC_23733 [Puccinia coronata f. sp. avenae]PLW24396.1 hypothetical protein PCASD_08365 [Puccinia coronata f. sp. avenae]PLW37924.1 hypothetical protein PCANC_15163 [Puccinia coronata f. sp. avenae]PLW42928.1 hypothetical protein PCASD_04695 [Puccinia coronata f. sp. avenae]